MGMNILMYVCLIFLTFSNVRIIERPHLELCLYLEPMNKISVVRFFIFLGLACAAGISAAQEKVYQKGLLAIQESPKAVQKYGPTGTAYDFGKTYFGRLKIATSSMKNGDMIKIFMGEKLAAAGKVDRNPPGVNLRLF